MPAKIQKIGGGAEFVQTTLRLPPEVNHALRDVALKSGRSFHAEMVHRLAQSVFLPDVLPANEKAPSEVIVLLQQIADDLSAVRWQTAPVKGVYGKAVEA